MSLPEHLFFDLDGTLTDPAPGIIGSFQHALAAMGQVVPAHDDLKWVIGPPLRKSFPKLGVAVDHVEAALEVYRAVYVGGRMYEAAVYAGIFELLDALRGRGHRLSIVTAKPHVYANPIVAHFGLAPHFEALHGPEIDGTHDHKGDLIRHILSTRGIAARDCLMIGDRANDVIAATENDMPAIGVLWGYGSADELSGAGASQLITTPAELLADLQLQAKIEAIRR